MIDLFVIKLVLSFLVGGLYTIISTVAADKLGSKIGGLVSGLPSTALFGLFFIGWTQNPQASMEATTLIPAIVGVGCIFVITYISFVKQNIWLAMGAAIFVWGVAAYSLITLHITSFVVSLVIFCVLFACAYFFVTRIVTITSSRGNTIIYSPKILLVRGIMSGTIIAVAVILAKVGGPVMGGVMSAFPVMAISTLLITYFAHGPSFSTSVAKSGMFAWLSIIIFIIVARYSYVPFGIIWGSLFALIVCYISAFFLYTFILKKHD